jgi:hypothetical protein
MKPSLALQKYQPQVLSLIARHPVSNLRVFGSVLRGEDHEDSDLDLLVDAQPQATLFDLGHLQDSLQNLLAVPVSVLTPQDLPTAFRAQVLAEARGLL